MSEQPMTFDAGTLTYAQVRALLGALEADITFVDGEDTVRYYNEAYRIFTRKPSDIGRNVVSCHSPGVQGRVAQLISELREGWRDDAEFLERKDGRLVRVRYLALRDEDGEYLGILEVARYLDETV